MVKGKPLTANNNLETNRYVEYVIRLLHKYQWLCVIDVTLDIINYVFLNYRLWRAVSGNVKDVKKKLNY
jgi:hypothetical protein